MAKKMKTYGKSVQYGPTMRINHYQSMRLEQHSPRKHVVLLIFKKTSSNEGIEQSFES